MCVTRTKEISSAHNVKGVLDSASILLLGMRECFLRCQRCWSLPLALVVSLRQAVKLVLTVAIDAVDTIRAGAVLALLGTRGTVLRLSSPLLSKVYIRHHVRITPLYRGTWRLVGSGPTGPTLLGTRSSIDAVGPVLLAGHFVRSLGGRFVKLCV